MIPLIINSGENTWRITTETIEVLLISNINYEEAGARLYFHVWMSNEAAVIDEKMRICFYF